MTPLILTPHADTPCPAIRRFSVHAQWRDHALHLRYCVEGKVSALSLPPPAAPQRVNGLWQTTCFEAFLHGGAEGYCEFNFAPNSAWAGYRFQRYRSGMSDLPLPTAPACVASHYAERFELAVRLDWPDAVHHLALSAVIEDAAGQRSYWALAHPPGKPDFHHADSFAAHFDSRGCASRA